MIEMSETIKKQPAKRALNMEIMKQINTIQSKYTKQFIDAGLTPEQIGRIPPIKNFQCRKVNPK
jgi:hypothetical protein